MTPNGWFQIANFFALVLVCARPLGVYMARVFERERTFADPILRPAERLIYRLTGIEHTGRYRLTVVPRATEPASTTFTLVANYGTSKTIQTLGAENARPRFSKNSFIDSFGGGTL